jgi:hypothetical protein
MVVEGRVICTSCGRVENVIILYDCEKNINKAVDNFFTNKNWTIISVKDDDTLVIICDKCINNDNFWKEIGSC